jgi:hypothetical protein
VCTLAANRNLLFSGSHQSIKVCCGFPTPSSPLFVLDAPAPAQSPVLRCLMGTGGADLGCWHAHTSGRTSWLEPLGARPCCHGRDAVCRQLRVGFGKGRLPLAVEPMAEVEPAGPRASRSGRCARCGKPSRRLPGMRPRLCLAPRTFYRPFTRMDRMYGAVGFPLPPPRSARREPTRFVGGGSRAAPSIASA